MGLDEHPKKFSEPLIKLVQKFSDSARFWEADDSPMIQSTELARCATNSSIQENLMQIASFPSKKLDSKRLK